MNKNQKLILEWLRVYIEEEADPLAAIADLRDFLLGGKLTNETSRAYLSLDEKEEREILAELAKE